MAAPEEATEYSGRHMLCDSDWPLGGDSVRMSAGRQMSTVYQMARPGLVKTKKAGSKSWGRHQACEDLGSALTSCRLGWRAQKIRCHGDADVTPHERPSRRYFFQVQFLRCRQAPSKACNHERLVHSAPRQALWSSRESCPSEYTGQNDMREASRPIPWFEKISSISSITSSSASPSRQLQNHHLHREHRQRQHRQQRLFDFYSSNVLQYITVCVGGGEGDPRGCPRLGLRHRQASKR